LRSGVIRVASTTTIGKKASDMDLQDIRASAPVPA
jgi:hypothetical protein